MRRSGSGLSALRLADGGLAIVVSDTGIGIAVADQERALRPYGRIGPRLDSRGAGWACRWQRL